MCYLYRGTRLYSSALIEARTKLPPFRRQHIQNTVVVPRSALRPSTQDTARGTCCAFPSYPLSTHIASVVDSGVGVSHAFSAQVKVLSFDRAGNRRGRAQIGAPCVLCWQNERRRWAKIYSHSHVQVCKRHIFAI